MLVTQSQLQGLLAASRPITSFHTLGIQRPREGEQLARGHTALIQQNIKFLLCQALCLGLRIRKSEQKSHKLQSCGVHTLVVEMGKKQGNHVKSETVTFDIRDVEYIGQVGQGRSFWDHSS